MVVTTGGGTNYAVTFARQGEDSLHRRDRRDANGRDLITELESEV